jgi:hypothetical protein
MMDDYDDAASLADQLLTWWCDDHQVLRDLVVAARTSRGISTVASRCRPHGPMTCPPP